MFKLDFDIPKPGRYIELKDNIYLIGSCFADEISDRLRQFKFNVTSNPFGTIYNPLSIYKVLQGDLDVDRMITYQDIHYHWDCHGEVSALNEPDLMKEINKRMHISNAQLNDAKWVILTFGTAFVYRLKTSGVLVANCHKAPQKDFTKGLLSVREIMEGFEDIFHKRLADKQVILTVSPVRHIKDGLAENNLSKSILLQAVHEMVHTYENVQYFPSYEIMIDELRDYRFYKKDLIHPSEEAVDYIWNRFTQTYMSERTNTFIKSWLTMLSAINHRPFQPKSTAHQKFIKETIRKLDQFKEVVDISHEQKLLEQQLI